MTDASLDTFPKLLMRHAQERGERPAIREKDLGIWQTWTWRRFADEVRALAAALAAEGFRRGEHIALIGDNRPRIYAGICAAVFPKRRNRSGNCSPETLWPTSATATSSNRRCT